MPRWILVKNNASDSQVWNTDADPNSSNGKPVARSNKITVGKRLFPRKLALLSCNVEHTEKVFTKVRQKLGRPKGRQNGAGQHQSALCLRSHCGLVPRSCSATRSSFSLQHGDTRCERGGRSRISSPVSGRVESHQIPYVQHQGPRRLGAATLREIRNFIRISSIN